MLVNHNPKTEKHSPCPEIMVIFLAMELAEPMQPQTRTEKRTVNYDYISRERPTKNGGMHGDKGACAHLFMGLLQLSLQN